MKKRGLFETVKAKLVIIALGAALIAAGVLVALNPVQVKVQSCIEDAGCFTVVPVVSPFVGLGVLFSFLGLVTVLYGYVREREPMV